VDGPGIEIEVDRVGGGNGNELAPLAKKKKETKRRRRGERSVKGHKGEIFTTSEASLINAREHQKVFGARGIVQKNGNATGGRVSFEGTA